MNNIQITRKCQLSIIRFSLMIIFSISMVSCEHNSGNLVQTEWIIRFLKNPTCQLPCWENIIPGETYIDDVFQILSEAYDITDVRGQEEFVTNSIGWDFPGSIEAEGAIDFNENNIVKKISLYVPHNYPLTLGDIIEEYGNPSHLVIGNCIGEWFSDWCVVDILYLDLGMSLQYSVYKPVGWKTLKIKPEAKINSIEIFLPGEDGYHEIYPAQQYPKKVEWHGYGRYENLRLQ